MIISLDPNDPRPIYVQIVDEVRRGIVLGTLAPGGALPSVRQLALDLRVNPNTVQQAYRELERLGLVFVRRGQGTFVAHSDGSAIAGQREELARTLARRAANEAYRIGLTADELIDAIRRIDSPRKPTGESE